VAPTPRRSARLGLAGPAACEFRSRRDDHYSRLEQRQLALGRQVVVVVGLLPGLTAQCPGDVPERVVAGRVGAQERPGRAALLYRRAKGVAAGVD